MENINEKIQKAIEENLPKQMGDVLQKRFAELEKIEVKHKDLSDLYENQSKELTKVKKERDAAITELAMKTELLVDIDKREKELAERVIKAELNEVKYKLVESEKRAEEMHGIVQTVFKSPVYRKSYSLIGGMKATGMKDNYNNDIYDNPNDKTGDVTETIE